MSWRSSACQIVNVGDGLAEIDRFANVVFDKTKAGVILERPDVIDPAGMEIVDANDLMSALDQSIAQMRTDEASSTGDDCAAGRSTLGPG